MKAVNRQLIRPESALLLQAFWCKATAVAELRLVGGVVKQLRAWLCKGPLTWCWTPCFVSKYSAKQFVSPGQVVDKVTDVQPACMQGQLSCRIPESFWTHLANPLLD